MQRPEPFDVRLVSARALTPGVRELGFERLDGQTVRFEPGQWVNLWLSKGDEPELKRAYSIASPPDGSPRFTLAVTRVEGGPASTRLHQLALGEELRVVGPNGFFTRAADEVAPALYVATGTGLAPLRSMLHAATRAATHAPQWLLFGTRHEGDILYRDELTELAARAPGVRYEVTLSRGGDAWKGRRGYVQTHVSALFEELAATSGGALPHVYVCGLDKMVSAVRDLARGELGVDRKRVHTERYD